jgi:hypothetical protein
VRRDKTKKKTNKFVFPTDGTSRKISKGYQHYLMNDIEILTRYSHEYTEESLRCKLRESLKNILFTSQEDLKRPDAESISIDLTTTIRNTFHFNDTILRFNLQKIDWTNISRQYDSYFMERNLSSCTLHASKKSTTLETLLDSFGNPTIWPSACTTSTFLVLIEVMYFVGSSTDNKRSAGVDDSVKQVFPNKLSDWTPSQHKILIYLTEVLRRNPSMQKKCFWTADHTSWLFRGISNGYHGEIVLRILKFWFVAFPDCTLVWISLLSKLIAALDAVEASLVENQKEKEGGADLARGKAITQQQIDISRERDSRKRSIGPRYLISKHYTARVVW